MFFSHSTFLSEKVISRKYLYVRNRNGNSEESSIFSPVRRLNLCPDFSYSFIEQWTDWRRDSCRGSDEMAFWLCDWKVHDTSFLKNQKCGIFWGWIRKRSKKIKIMLLDLLKMRASRKRVKRKWTNSRRSLEIKNMKKLEMEVV